jgi:hypothetical protein
LNEDVQYEVVGLLEQPAGGPQSVPKVGSSYGDAWLSALHLQDEPGTNEIQVTLAVGSHAEFVPMVLDLLAGVVSSLAIVTSGCSNTEDLGNSYRTSFPHLSLHLAKFFDLEAADIVMENIDDGTSRFLFSFPIDFAALEQHYERLAEKLRHFDQLSARAVHPETRDSLLILFLENDILSVSFMMKDGQLCWKGSRFQPISWSSANSFSFDLEIDCNVRLLGLSFAALPFPSLGLRCQLSRNIDGPGGSFVMTCVSVGELVLENIAAFVFDVTRFRQLLLERFTFEINHRCTDKEDGNGWLLHCFYRIPFPVAGVAQLFAQHFRDFVTRQLQEMQVLAACQDFLIALSLDAVSLSSESKVHQAGREA